MNVALFGGTFDPVHRGHLALARAAQERFGLAQVHFIPANVPPHKQGQRRTGFVHRYAMVVLATLEEKRFIPSLLEAPSVFSVDSTKAHKISRPAPSYTIETVRRFKRSLKKGDRLFFLIGIDAFLDIGKWHESEALLRKCEFVVASRPGFSMKDIAGALPPALRRSVRLSRTTGDKARLEADGAVIHLLPGVYQPMSSTAIRKAAAQGRSVTRWVPPPVAHYIKKMHLYKPYREE